MKPAADVYRGDELVAHFYRTADGTRLEFLPRAGASDGFFATSVSITKEPVLSPGLHPFFLNLLPEGARLQLLLDAAKAKDDLLGLLMRLGWDTIGDIAVLPNRVKPESHAVMVPQRKLSAVSFWDLFYEGIKHPDAAVPGAQEKISSSTIAFGVRTANIPSAILKLNPKRFPRLVQNEEFFLRMATACGLKANHAQLVEDRLGETGLLVTRFDRLKVGKSIEKLHQEDCCQLLNQIPANKYEVTMSQVATAIAEHASAPVVEISRLLDLYAFSYIIGNADLHAKNISLLWTNAVRLTPVYDMLTTLPYGLDKKMALKLDGRDDNFRIDHLCEFGKRYGVLEHATRLSIERICHRAAPWIGRMSEIGWDSKTTEKLQREVASRLAKLRR